MSKMIEQDGKFYRLRRGKLVEIPPEWQGKVPNEQTKRKRASHQTPSQRNARQRNMLGDETFDWSNYRNRRYEDRDDNA